MLLFSLTLSFSRLLSRTLKIKIYKTIILPDVVYGCETRSLTLRQECRLMVFEKRILRRIYGPKRDENFCFGGLNGIGVQSLKWFGSLASFPGVVGRGSGSLPMRGSHLHQIGESVSSIDFQCE